VTIDGILNNSVASFFSDIIFDFDAVYLSDDDFFVGGRFRYVRLIVG
jgi:hypothetical protein